MSQTPGLCSRYEGSNNIVIVPTVSLSKNIPTLSVDTSTQQTHVAEQKVTSGGYTKNASVLVQPKPTPTIVNQSKPSFERQLEQLTPSEQGQGETPSTEDVKKNLTNVEDLNRTKKVNSWASNYLQSIGHNNLKPIKINLSISKNKEKYGTSLENKYDLDKSTPLKNTSLIDSNLKMADKLKVSEPNQKTIGTHTSINIDNLNSARSVKCNSHINEKSNIHVKMASVIPKRTNIILPSSINYNMNDTIYSNNNSSTVPLPYPNLLVKSVGESAYCYNDGNCEIDIFDTNQSKVNSNISIEQKARTMNLPTHKEMCEDFIKEINKNKITFKRKKDHPKSPPAMNKKDAEKSPSEINEKLKSHIKKYKSTDKLEKPVKNEEKLRSIKIDTIKTLNKNEIKKPKTSQKNNKSDKKDEKLDKKHCDPKKKVKNLECQHDILVKKKDTKTIIDLKGFDSSERQNLKRVRTNSEDLSVSSSGIRSGTYTKSVVQVTKNPSKKQRLDENFDLRSKLSRVNERIYRNMHTQKDLMHKIPKPCENLTIRVENKTDEKHKSPKKSGVPKYKTKKCKKLKLIINVVCPGSDYETTSSDSSSETENSLIPNMDLSFLDDFNVDEIVDSLKYSPKHKIKSPLLDEIKKEDDIKTDEPELKLSTILNNMLNANSETYNNRVQANCKIEENIQNNSSTRSNVMNNPSLVTDGEMSKMKNGGANANTTNWEQMINFTPHAIIKILSEKKSQLDRQKTVSCKDSKDLQMKSSTKIKELNADAINKNQVEPANEDTEIQITDDAIIHDPEIHIIDLTIEESFTKNNTVTGKPKLTEKQNIKNKQSKEVKINNNGHKTKEKSADLLRAVPNTHRNDNNGREKINSVSEETDDVVRTTTLIKNEECCIDLTNDNLDDKMPLNLSTNKTVVVTDKQRNLAGENNKHNEYQDENIEVFLKKQQKINLLSLDSVVCKNNEPIEIDIQKVNDKKEFNGIVSVRTKKENAYAINNSNDTYAKKITDTDNKKLERTNLVKTVLNHEIAGQEIKEVNNNKTINEKHLKLIPNPVVDKPNENNNLMEIETQKNNDLKDTHENSAVQIREDNSKEVENKNDHNDTKEITNVDNIIELFESSPANSNEKMSKKETDKEQGSTVLKDETANENNTICCKVFETTQKVIKNIVETVWDTTIEPENTSTSNVGTNSETGNIFVAKTEPGNTTGTNNNAKKEAVAKKNQPIAKKAKNLNITGENKALAMLLEERMLEYMHKDIKIIKLIHKGKFSRIFSCKDPNGENYAAKVLLTNAKTRHAKGILQEQMIRQLQQDIPKENLNIVYLIDGFGIKRHWCLLMEFYPKTLQQALNAQVIKKPFHIDRVQDLARQLISAVMVLRNNEIIHSNIKPTHILMNATCNRLKLCGFDNAYHRQNMYPLPNIGTAIYRAPEIILGFSAGYSIDVWSSALVIYQMATNQTLFTGIYNNDILFKQMSTFGNLPRDMVESSMFKNQHFMDRMFMRRVGIKGQDAELFQNFYKTRRMQMEIISAYNNYWSIRNVNGRDSDMFKLTALQRLLEKMLILDPRQRLAIEFVCIDPFVYDILS